MRRLGIGVCLFALSGAQGWATPLVVARFDKGLIVGTNEVRGDGSRTCKLHVAKHAVVLMGVSGPSDDAGGKPDVAGARLDKALGGQDLSMTQLADAVRGVAKGAAREMSAFSASADGFAFRFVLVDVEASGPAVLGFTMKGKDAETLDYVPLEEAVQVNELRDFSQGTGRVRHIAPSEEAAVEAVRKQLALDVSLQSAKPTQAFQPPFSIMEVRNDGTMTLISSPGECTQEKVNGASGQ